jgi:hypothetical protein
MVIALAPVEPAAAASDSVNNKFIAIILLVFSKKKCDPAFGSRGFILLVIKK